MKKNIFITGASAGIGEACAILFAQKGHDLILCARREHKLINIQNQLTNKYNINVHILPTDVRDKKAIETSFKNLPINHIDVLINSAGLALGKDNFEHADLCDWETMIDTNIKGLMYVTKYALPFLIKSSGAHIFNLGSIAGINVYEEGNLYCATKAAVKAMSEGMRIDLLKHGIKITNIQPGAVETEFSIVRLKNDMKKINKVYENFKPLSATDIALIIDNCMSLPLQVCINEITVTPLQQANAYYIFKK